MADGTAQQVESFDRKKSCMRPWFQPNLDRHKIAWDAACGKENLPCCQNGLEMTAFNA
jgi:hypothetical protein